MNAFSTFRRTSAVLALAASALALIALPTTASAQTTELVTGPAVVFEELTQSSPDAILVGSYSLDGLDTAFAQLWTITFTGESSWPNSGFIEISLNTTPVILGQLTLSPPTSFGAWSFQEPFAFSGVLNSVEFSFFSIGADDGNGAWNHNSSFQLNSAVISAAPMAPVPEASSWAMFAVGLAGVGFAAAKRSRNGQLSGLGQLKG